ncbi:MAG: NAD(P)/FAD-dependent oxidoreductase, partial [Anaerolineaceae bacterium]
RSDTRLSLYEINTLLAETTRNLILTDWGLNGPAVMDLSHHISTRPNAKLDLILNPLFNSEGELRDLIARKHGTATPLRVILGSVLPPKLPPVLIARAGYPVDVFINELNNEQTDKVLKSAAAMSFKVTGVRGFEYCQVCAGGVPVSEVDPMNMRSRLIPGLILVGETLDVVGPCGGYNLQFAFSSGAVAGMEINNPPK